MFFFFVCVSLLSFLWCNISMLKFVFDRWDFPQSPFVVFFFPLAVLLWKKKNKEQVTVFDAVVLMCVVDVRIVCLFGT